MYTGAACITGLGLGAMVFTLVCFSCPQAKANMPNDSQAAPLLNMPMTHKLKQTDTDRAVYIFSQSARLHRCAKERTWIK